MQIHSFVRAAVAAAALVVTTAPAVAQQHHTVVPHDKVQWGPAPPVLPPGAQIAVLQGNPEAAGPVTLRLKFPAGYRVPPHWHSMAEAVTVVSGAFYVGAGDKLDTNASQLLQPGGFVLLPAQMRHYAWVKAETVVQIDLQGPFDIFYVNPADAPARSNTR